MYVCIYIYTYIYIYIYTYIYIYIYIYISTAAAVRFRTGLAHAGVRDQSLEGGMMRLENPHRAKKDQLKFLELILLANSTLPPS